MCGVRMAPIHLEFSRTVAQMRVAHQHAYQSEVVSSVFRTCVWRQLDLTSRYVGLLQLEIPQQIHFQVMFRAPLGAGDVSQPGRSQHER